MTQEFERSLRKLLIITEKIVMDELNDWKFPQTDVQKYHNYVEAANIVLLLKEELSMKCSRSSKKFVQTKIKFRE